MKTSLLIFSANQWTGFYMIDTSVMKEFNGESGSVVKTFHSSLTEFFKIRLGAQPRFETETRYKASDDPKVEIVLMQL